MSKRDHVRACEAQRDAILRAHECKGSRTDAKVLDAVFGWLTSWSRLSDLVRLDDLAAVVFVVEPTRVLPWQRKRVRESLRRWDDWGIVRYRAQRGRPSKEIGGPVISSS